MLNIFFDLVDEQTLGELRIIVVIDSKASLSLRLYSFQFIEFVIIGSFKETIHA